jgi:hypothetical protein
MVSSYSKFQKVDMLISNWVDFLTKTSSKNESILMMGFGTQCFLDLSKVYGFKWSIFVCVFKCCNSKNYLFNTFILRNMKRHNNMFLFIAYLTSFLITTSLFSLSHLAFSCYIIKSKLGLT